MDKLHFELVDYRPEYALELVKMWRRSFQRAMGLEEQDNFGELSAQLDFLSAIDTATIHVAMDRESSTILGFMVLSGEKLDHLYVHVDYQGLGLGTTLLNLARQKSPAGLELFTFQRNQAAQDFYRSRGFREVQRGFAGFRDNPWATQREQLADIKFRWEPGAARA